jgi:ribosome recycling factor
MIAAVERAIINSNLGLNPANDGETIRLNLPPLTEERRRDLVKKVKAEIEIAKINVRKVRQESNDDLRKLKNEGVSEDAVKVGEERVQKLTDKYIDLVEQMFTAKETDIMSV